MTKEIQIKVESLQQSVSPTAPVPVVVKTCWMYNFISKIIATIKGQK